MQPVFDDALRRRGRVGALRRGDDRNRGREQHLTLVSGLQHRDGWRDRLAGPLHRDDRLRRRSPALRRRSVRGHCASERRWHPYVHDHERRATIIVRVVKNWVGTPSSATIFVDADGARHTTSRRSPRPTATASPTHTRSQRRSTSARRPCLQGTRPRSTAARGPSPTAADRSPSPHRTPAAEPSPASSPTPSCSRAFASSSSGSVRRRRRRSSSTPTEQRHTTSRRSPRPTATASPTRTPSRRESRSARPPYRPAMRRRSDAAPALRSHMRAARSRSRPRRSTAQTLTCVITNTQQFSTVRVVKNWVGLRSTATLFVDADGVAPYDASTTAPGDGDSVSNHVPGLDGGHGRRDRGSGRLHGDDSMRRRRTAAVRRRSVRGHLAGDCRSDPHLHDQQCRDPPAARVHCPCREGLGRRCLPRRRSSSTRTAWPRSMTRRSRSPTETAPRSTTSSPLR